MNKYTVTFALGMDTLVTIKVESYSRDYAVRDAEERLYSLFFLAGDGESNVDLEVVSCFTNI